MTFVVPKDADGTIPSPAATRIRDRDIDEIVLSTLPPGTSRWLGLDIPNRLRGGVSVPVTVVNEGEAATRG